MFASYEQDAMIASNRFFLYDWQETIRKALVGKIYYRPDKLKPMIQETTFTFDELGITQKVKRKKFVEKNSYLGGLIRTGHDEEWSEYVDLHERVEFFIHLCYILEIDYKIDKEKKTFEVSNK